MAFLNVDSQKAVTKDRQANRMVVSFRLMRLLVGILGLSIGVLLPLLAALLSQCAIVQESISHYYYSIAGDVFVGLLCAVAFFLISYPGEGRWEDIWTNVAGVCALAVAFFPTGYHQLNNTCTSYSFVYADWVSTVHLLSAGAFFLILGGVAFFQFSKIGGTRDQPPTRAKAANFYRGCGLLMWLCILSLVPMTFSESYRTLLSANKIVFVVEVIALTAFGTAWLKKGAENKPLVGDNNRGR